MEITQDVQSEVKSLGSLLQDSLVVGETRDFEESGDCQSFSFDIKLLKISGTICRTGDLEFRGSVFGFEIAHTKVDLSGGELCFNPKLGALVGVKYCFSLRNDCLYTRGEIDGWFRKLTDWNEKILCF